MENYKEMWKMMENYSFDLETQQIKLFYCAICDKLLIDTYEGRCGFTYCKKCVDKFINEGGQSCPCGSDECWTDTIDFGKYPKKSHFSDKIISEMMVKCPLNACKYKYALIKMSDHLKICDNWIGCPFIEVGCDKIKLERNKVSDHLMVELYEHNMLMVEWMRNMKNEVINLMRSIINEITINKIDKSINSFVDVSFEHSRAVTEEHFNDFRQEIISTKQKIDRLNQKLKESQEIFNRKIHLCKVDNEILSRKHHKLGEENRRLIEENRKLIEENNQQQKSPKEKKSANQYSCESCDTFRMIKNKEIEQMLEEIARLTEKIGTLEIKKTPSFWRKIFIEQSESMPKPVAISNAPIESFASFQWIGNEISHSHKFSSAPGKWYFYNNQYEIRFHIFTTGCQNNHVNTHICIRFRILDGIAKLKPNRWPLECVITVSMKSAITEQKISLEKNLIFQQPTIDQLFELSPQFHFIKSELNAKNIINNDSVLIEFSMHLHR